MPTHHWYRTAVPMALSAIMLSGCLSGGGGGGDDAPAGEPEAVTREQDKRAFFTEELPDVVMVKLANTTRYFGKYDGLQGDALYVAEVPDDWDGKGLIMWTHGYGGDVLEVKLQQPSTAWRDAVIGAGYAWAASSYSANWYDARAGLEDTNKLALNLIDYIEQDHGQRVASAPPSQYLISGGSLGGHIAAAAVERENIERAQFKVEYAGAAPFCQSEQNEFQWLGDYTRAMLEISSFNDRDYSDFQSLVGDFQNFGTVSLLVNPGPMVTELFNTLPNGWPNWSSPKGEAGQRLMAIAENLSGGERPIFEFGFASALQDVVLGTGGSDGKINGILTKHIYDNQDTDYRWTTGPEPTDEEVAFNERVPRITADPEANPLRDDGVRWIPLVNGDFDVPVLTMHTLGDFYVPFKHQQLYRERALENGNADMLVQRAIRAPSHCDFSDGEVQAAINDWLKWVNDDIKPAGDEVLDPAVVADANYGCTFTVGERDKLPTCTVVR